MYIYIYIYIYIPEDLGIGTVSGQPCSTLSGKDEDPRAPCALML